MNEEGFERYAERVLAGTARTLGEAYKRQMKGKIYGAHACISFTEIHSAHIRNHDYCK
jgi:hypothetical protein